MSDRSTQSDDCGDGEHLYLFTQKILLLTQARHQEQFGICKMKTAYCRKTLNAVLTLRVFDFTQWKHYCVPWNLKR